MTKNIEDFKPLKLYGEGFFYGKRLKAMLYTINHADGSRSYKVVCYKTKKEIYTTKYFFDNAIKPNEYKKQNELYIKASNFARNWLNTCKY